MDRYLARLPDILKETFELAEKIGRDGITESMKEDVLKLLELTTVELTVNNKKELTVKLFDVLEGMIPGGKSVLEAPSGVEPLSTALQAAV